MDSHPTTDPSMSDPGTVSDASVDDRPAIRVAIADDNAVVRMGIRSLLGTADDVVVVGEAGDGLAAVALAKAKKPDVMLLDVRMPRQDGVVSAREVTEYTSVLMLTYSDSAEVISAAVQAGALGYLVHGNFSEDELLSAVRMAARGLRHVLGPGRGRAVPTRVATAASPGGHVRAVGARGRRDGAGGAGSRQQRASRGRCSSRRRRSRTTSTRSSPSSV